VSPSAARFKAGWRHRPAFLVWVVDSLVAAIHGHATSDCGFQEAVAKPTKKKMADFKQQWLARPLCVL